MTERREASVDDVGQAERFSRRVDAVVVRGQIDEGEPTIAVGLHRADDRAARHREQEHLRLREHGPVARSRDAAKVTRRRLRLPRHRRDVRRAREDRRRHRVVGGDLRERALELRAAHGTAACAGIGHRVGRAIRIPDPPRAEVAGGRGRERGAHLTHGRGDVVQIGSGPDDGLAGVLLVLGEVTPVLIHLPLIARARLIALVVHRDVEVEDALAHPAVPVLQLLGIRARVRPAALRLRPVAVGDRVGAHAHARTDRVALDVDLAHDVRDLVAAPLRPLRVRPHGPIGAPGRLLEARDRDGVVAPGGHAYLAVAVGVADAVEVDAVDGVVRDDARRGVHDPLRRIGVTRIDEPVGVRLHQAVVT